MTAISPHGEAKTCGGLSPPELVEAITLLKVPFSKIVKDWTAPASTWLTALRIIPSYIDDNVYVRKDHATH